MAWTKNPIDTIANLPAATGLQDWGIYEELIAAYVERAKVAQELTGYGGATNFDLYNPWGATSDVNFAEASSIATFQQDVLNLVDTNYGSSTKNIWVCEDLLTSDKLPVIDLTAPDVNVLDPADSQSFVWGRGTSDTNDLIGDLGVGRSGTDIFTRKYGTPGAITTNYGLCEAGDYVGILKDSTNIVAPLWDELYLILNTLNVAIDTDIAGVSWYRRTGTGTNAVRATAISDAKASWDAASYTYQGTLRRAFVRCDLTTDYNCTLEREYHTVDITCPITIPSTCRYYAFAIDDHVSHSFDEWDNDGYGWIQDRLNFVHAFAESSVATRSVSELMKSNSYPPITSADSGQRGSMIGGQLGVSPVTDYAVFHCAFDKMT